MYTIGNIIFGVAFDHENGREIAELFFNDYDPDDLGFLNWYSGSSEYTPFAFGIEVSGIDEIDNINLDKFFKSLESNREENESQYKDFLAHFLSNYNQFYKEELDEEAQDKINEIINTKPNYWIVWSTS